MLRTYDTKRPYVRESSTLWLIKYKMNAMERASNDPRQMRRGECIEYEYEYEIFIAQISQRYIEV